MKITWYTTLSEVYQWKDYKNGISDPLENIKRACMSVREHFGKNANFIKTSRNVLLTFMGHPDIREIMSINKLPEDYLNTLKSGKAFIKSLFGIKEIKIDNRIKGKMLIAYKENDEIYPDEKAVYEIRGIL